METGEHPGDATEAGTGDAAATKDKKRKRVRLTFKRSLVTSPRIFHEIVFNMQTHCIVVVFKV